jgi:FkbM family methyltransferase
VESLGRWLRDTLIPPSVHLRRRARRERRRGEPEFNLLTDFVVPGRTALDIGAYYGVWSHRMRELTQTVHAFEPHPVLYSRLERALAGRVTTHNLALSDQAGEAEFRVPRRGAGYSLPGGSLKALATGDDFISMTVKTARLDDLSIEDVGFMKIDVEGNEGAVLAGARRTIERDRPAMLVEIVEYQHARPVEELIGEVEAYGYDGFGFLGGVLTPWREIDMDVHHRRPATPRDFIFNFAFRPR